MAAEIIREDISTEPSWEKQEQIRQIGQLVIDAVGDLDDSLLATADHHLADYDKSTQESIFGRALLAQLVTDKGRLLFELEILEALENAPATDPCQDFIAANPGVRLEQVARSLPLEMTAIKARLAGIGCYLIAGRLYLPEQLSEDYRDDFCRRQVDAHLGDQSPEIQDAVLARPNLFDEILRNDDGLRVDRRLGLSLAKIKQQVLIDDCLKDRDEGVLVSDVVEATGLSKGQVYIRLREVDNLPVYGFIYRRDHSGVGRTAIRQVVSHYMTDHDQEVRDWVIDWAQSSDLFFDEDGQTKLTLAAALRVLQGAAGCETVHRFLLDQPGMTVAELVDITGLRPGTIYEYVERSGWYLVNSRIYTSKDTVKAPLSVLEERVFDMIELYLYDYDPDIRLSVRDKIDWSKVLTPDQANVRRGNVIREILLQSARQEMLELNLRQQPGMTAAQIATTINIALSTVETYLRRIDHFILAGRVYLKDQIDQVDQTAWLTEAVARHLTDYDPDIRQRVVTAPGLFEACVTQAVTNNQEPRLASLLRQFADIEITKEYIKDNDGASVANLKQLLGVSSKTVSDYIDRLGYKDQAGFVLLKSETAAAVLDIDRIVALVLAGADVQIRDRVSARPEIKALWQTKLESGQVDDSDYTALQALIKDLARQEEFRDLLERRPGQSFAAAVEMAGIDQRTARKYIKQLNYYLLGDQAFGAAALIDSRQYNRDLIDRYISDCDQAVASRLAADPNLLAAICSQGSRVAISEHHVRSRLQRKLYAIVISDHINISPRASVADIAAALSIPPTTVRTIAQENELDIYQPGPSRVESKMIPTVIEDCLACYDQAIQARVRASPQLDAVINGDHWSLLAVRKIVQKIAHGEVIRDYLAKNPGAQFSEIAAATGLEKVSIYRHIDEIGYQSLAGYVFSKESLEAMTVTDQIQAVVDRHLYDFSPAVRQRVADSAEVIDIWQSENFDQQLRGLFALLGHLGRQETFRDLVVAKPGLTIDQICQEIDVQRTSVYKYMAAVGARSIADFVYMNSDLDRFADDIRNHLIDSCLADYGSSIRERVRNLPDLAAEISLKETDPTNARALASRRLTALANIESFKESVEKDPGRLIGDIASELKLAPASLRDYAKGISGYRIVRSRVYPPPTAASADAKTIEIEMIINHYLPDVSKEIKEKIISRDDLSRHFEDQSGELIGFNQKSKRISQRLAAQAAIQTSLQAHGFAAIYDISQDLAVSQGLVRKAAQELDYAVINNYAFAVSATEPVETEQLGQVCAHMTQAWLSDQPDSIRSRVATSTDLGDLIVGASGRLKTKDQQIPHIIRRLGVMELARDHINQSPGADPEMIATLVGLDVSDLNRHLATIDCRSHIGRLYPNSVLDSQASAANQSQSLLDLFDHYMADESDRTRQAVFGLPDIAERLTDDNGWALLPSGPVNKTLVGIVNYVRVGEFVRQAAEARTTPAIGRDLGLGVSTVKRLVREHDFITIKDHVFPITGGGSEADSSQLLQMATEKLLADYPESIRQAVLESEPLQQAFDSSYRKNHRRQFINLIESEARRLSLQNHLKQQPDQTFDQLLDRFSISANTLRTDISELERRQPAILAGSPHLKPDRAILSSAAQDHWRSFIDSYLSHIPAAVADRVRRLSDIESNLATAYDLERSLRKLVRQEWVREIGQNRPGTSLAEVIREVGVGIGSVRQYTGVVDCLIFLGSIFSRQQMEDLTDLEILGLIVRDALADYSDEIQAQISSNPDLLDMIKRARGQPIGSKNPSLRTQIEKMAQQLQVGDHVRRQPGIRSADIAEMLSISVSSLNAHRKALGIVTRAGRLYWPDQLPPNQAKKGSTPPRPRSARQTTAKKPRPKPRSTPSRTSRSSRQKPAASRRTSPKRPLDEVAVANEIKRQYVDLDRPLDQAIIASGIDRPTYDKWFLGNKQFSEILLPFLPFPETDEKPVAPSGLQRKSGFSALRGQQYRNYMKQTTLSDRRQQRQQLTKALESKPSLAADLESGEMTDDILDMVIDFEWGDAWPFIIFETLGDS